MNLRKMEVDEDENFFATSSYIPVTRPNRKRNSASAGFVDNTLLDDFNRKLKLTPASQERLAVADALLKDPQFRHLLLKELPECYIRKMARTSSEWRTDACRIIREKRGNNAFSLLWISNQGDPQRAATCNNMEFDLKMFLHPAYLGGFSVQTKTKSETSCGPLEIRENNQLSQVAHHVMPGQITTPTKVGFILTYGSANMVSEFMAMEQDENKTMKSSSLGAAMVLVLSPSIIASTPDGQRIIDSLGSNDRKLVTSILFPESAHILMECFLVPSSLSESTPCISSVIGQRGGFDKKPKLLILYQYLNLVDSKPGIVEVLNSLELTHGSDGFPMITGIYNYLDGSVVTRRDGDELVSDPVACGLLICGDDFCKTFVTSMNLFNAVNETMEIYFKKFLDFYSSTSAFSTKYALLFYHNEVATNDEKGKFINFIDCFKKLLPEVRLHGIGSLSGAHGMFVNPDGNESFNQLNVKMMELTGTLDEKTSVVYMDIILVLLSYQAD